MVSEHLVEVVPLLFGLKLLKPLRFDAAEPFPHLKAGFRSVYLSVGLSGISVRMA